jgi:putative DNA primase/helicase
MLTMPKLSPEMEAVFLDFPEARRKQQGPATLILPPPSQPMDCAREFVAQNCLRDGLHVLRYWRDGWWQWRQSHWFEIDGRTVRSMLYAFTEHAIYENDKGEEKQWSPTRRKIGDMVEALGAILILSDEFEQPAWLDQRSTGPIVATANGLLDIERRDLLPHTPQYFNQTFVPFDYDPHAPEPTKWLAFLGDLWPDEPNAIDVLGEWFGYVISGRLDLHKILLVVGPTRGGKGAIARVLAALVGKQNFCGPTLTGLGGGFWACTANRQTACYYFGRPVHRKKWQRRCRAVAKHLRRRHINGQQEE